MSTKVFIAYADSYIGRNTLEQYFLRPAQYSVYGCTWEEDAVEQLRETYSQRVFDALPLPNNDDESADNEMGSVPIGNSRSTLVPEKKIVQQSTFFHRRDVSAVRNALLQCDWLIVELRQAQDIFEMLNFIKKSSFVKVKKFVLLSNFLTWYATPSLTGDANQEDRDGANEDDEMEESEVESLTAPFPAPADGLYNSLLDVEEENEEEGEGQGEVLTEEQFNRRVPHVQYFNWRDAEKAVAASHRANGLPLETFVVFAGLPYGAGEGPLEPFFRLSWSTDSEDLLPVFQPGTQKIPMVHVSDLAEMTRRLLRCPTDELPNPALRYVFAVDGSNLSWSAIVAAINKGFRNTRPTAVVKQDKFPLHNNTELFTLNLTVSNETADALMSRDDDDVEPVVMSSPIKRHDGSWVSPGGFATNILNVCAEFCAKREVTPLRIAVVGPPQAGKSHLANKLSLHYKIPVFSLEGIVAFYEQGIAELRGKLEDLKQQLLQKETDRRLQIKQKRILKRKRGAGEDRDNSEEDEGAPPHHQSGSEEDEMEERQLALTSEEQQELEGFVEELYEGSSVVANWRSEMAEMERVMLMRQYISSNESSDPNPKKKGAKKKSLKDAQKKKDEEIQQIKETITTAPFQNKAIAIMLRKCLSHAESYNQGFVLDGIPFSVELSRLCFRTGELIPPATEEEALQQFLRPDAIPEKENEPDDSSPPAVEQCEESLLVDYVFTLESGENFLLNRLNANKSNMGADALEDFHARMSIYKKEFFDSPYTVTNFFECAATDPSTSVLCGGRKVSINLIPVDSTEPVSLPPPPQSEYAEIPPSHLETIVYECVGAPHNFGKTPLELHREQVRAKNYNKEQLIRQVNEVKAVQDREKDAFKTESMHRNENSKALSEMKKADQMSLELRSEPLREYLSKSILPLLSKGLIEICETRPEDPVEALAQWLLRNNPSDDIFSDL